MSLALLSVLRSGPSTVRRRRADECRISKTVRQSRQGVVASPVLSDERPRGKTASVCADGTVPDIPAICGSHLGLSFPPFWKVTIVQV